MLKGGNLVLGDVLIPWCFVLSAVSHVLCTSIIASGLLHGNRDPDCRGYSATEENSGDRGCAGV